MKKENHNHSNNGAEPSSLNIAPIVWFLVSLAVSTVIICALMAGLLKAFESRVEKEEKRSPLSAERELIAPEPRVQLAPSNPGQVEGMEPPNLKEEHPLAEMERFRREENEKLNSYGWIDEKRGLARIPIAEAKKLLLQRGELHTRQPNASQPANSRATTAPTRVE